MNTRQIQELIKFVVKSGATEIDIEKEGFKISIKTPAYRKGGTTGTEQVVVTTPAAIPYQVIPTIPLPVQKAEESPIVIEKKSQPSKEESKYVPFKSPMIGTFYRSPSPDKPAFVNIGDEVSQGKVLCIIEAMKLFNEIEAEFPCRIIKVLVNESTPVEYDQPLFLVEPL